MTTLRLFTSNSNMWHYHCPITPSLPRGTMSDWHVTILFFFKLKKNKKLKKKKSKKPHADTWHIINTVTMQLMVKNWLQRIFQNRDSIESNKNEGPTWDFTTKIRTSEMI